VFAAGCALAFWFASLSAGAAAAATTDKPAPASPGPKTAASAAAAAGYNPSQEIRYGDAAAFRNLVPPAMLEQQAGAAYKQLIAAATSDKMLLPASDYRVKRVRKIAQKLIPASLKWNERAKQWHWEINVVKSARVDLLCLPGGKIVVFTGLIDRLRPNDDELGMLIGHDIAHALREHAREKLGQLQAMQMGAGTIPQMFGMADLGASPLGIGSALLDIHYGRADETEADVIGTDIAARAGFDPRAGVTLWNRLASLKPRGKIELLQQHPFDASRIADLKRRQPDMLALYAKAIGKSVDALPRYRMRGTGN
jgi:predicted Zn-dependent protease